MSVFGFIRDPVYVDVMDVSQFQPTSSFPCDFSSSPYKDTAALTQQPSPPTLNRSMTNNPTLRDNCTVDDLKKLRDKIQREILTESDILVRLLQERHQLGEEVHFRLVSIEQLHRLLESSCYYRRIFIS